MFLSVNEYNENEKKGKKILSCRFLEAFQPELFEKLGYPTRIEDETEIYKFLDSMHEGRLRYYYEDRNYKFAPTYEEFEMLKEVSRDIYQLSKERYGKGIIVKAPLIASINVLRRIKYLGGQ